MKNLNFICVTLLLLLAGCGGDGTVTLKGSVTFNGEKVQNGSITLEPVDGKGSSSGASIIDGNYEIKKIKPGEKIVRINAAYVIGQQKANDNPEDKTMIDLYESLIPKEYNSESKEKINIPQTSSTKDFAITGEDPRKSTAPKK